MQCIFDIVYHFLKWIEHTTGFTYHEVNIIAYYIILPVIFIYCIGLVLKTQKLLWYYTGITLIVLVLIPDFNSFSTWLFNKSVSFLNRFNAVGLNYTQASVVICVFVPLLLLGILLVINKYKKKT